jgi:hypothetical protein
MHKKSLWLPLLIQALALLMASVALAQPPGDPDAARPGETITGIVEFDGAYVYSGPDFAYETIGQLDKNYAVRVLGRSGDFYYSWSGDEWLEIAYQERVGWVYARLIRTSIPFNSIPPTGRKLPRNFNGRVPGFFDLSENICDSWTGTFTRSGDFLAGDDRLTVTYPAMVGANVYSVIVISPTGERVAFDSETTTAEILLSRLPQMGGTYTWRVAPYLALQRERYAWQQICLLQTGGTFEKPGPTATRPPRFRFGARATPLPPSPTPPLLP